MFSTMIYQEITSKEAKTERAEVRFNCYKKSFKFSFYSIVYFLISQGFLTIIM